MGYERMAFSQTLQAKIAARQVSESSVIATADILRQQAFDRIKPVYDAVSATVQGLAGNDIFASVFGSEPEVVFKWSDINPSGCHLVVRGPIGSFSIIISHWPALMNKPSQTKLKLTIHPGSVLSKILGCGFAYGSATPVEGYIDDLSGFLVDCEDMLAEFLADVVTMTNIGEPMPGT